MRRIFVIFTIAAAAYRHGGGSQELPATKLEGHKQSPIMRLGTVHLRHESGQIQSLAVSGDGRLIATAGDDGSVRVWSISGGQAGNGRTWPLQGVVSLAMSQSGQFLATGTVSGAVTVWDVASGMTLFEQQTAASSILALAFVGTGTDFVCIRRFHAKTRGDVLELWRGNVPPIVVATNIAVGDDVATAFAVSPDAKHVACSIDSATVGVWRIGDGKTAIRFRHGGNEYAVPAFAPDCRHLAISNYHDVQIWNIEATKKLESLPQPWVNTLEFNKDGSSIAAVHWPNGNLNARLSVWTWQNGTPRLVRDSVIGDVWLSMFGERGAILVTTPGRVIRVFDVASGQRLDAQLGHESAVTSVAFAPDGRLFASSGDTGTTRFWKVATGALLCRIDDDIDLFPGSLARVKTIANIPKGWFRCAKQQTGLEYEIDRPYRNVLPLKSKKKQLGCAAWSPNGKLVATGGWSVNIWDIEEGKRRYSKRLDYEVSQLCFSGDGKMLIAAGSRRSMYHRKGQHPDSIMVVDVTSGDRVPRRFDFSEDTETLALSPDGRHLASGGSTETDGADRRNAIAIWDFESGRQLTIAPIFTGIIHCVAWSPNGRLLACCGHWELDVQNGKKHGNLAIFDPYGTGGHRVLEGHNGAVYSVSFQPTTGLLASGGADGAIRIWDAVRARQMAVLTAHSGAVRAIAFSPNGKLLASGSSDTTVCIWDVGSVD